MKCFGPNFELISRLFPGRPRKALANKWRRENKLNPNRVAESYSGKGSIDGLEKIVEALQQTEVCSKALSPSLPSPAHQFCELCYSGILGGASHGFGS